MNSKWFKDRKNALKSELSNLKHFKLTKTINENKILEIEGRLKEIDYIIYKFKKYEWLK